MIVITNAAVALSVKLCKTDIFLKLKLLYVLCQIADSFKINNMNFCFDFNSDDTYKKAADLIFDNF